MFDFCNYYDNIIVIEDANCLRNYQLTPFIKDLMGEEWCNEFNIWADHSLPKEPTCYMIGKNKLITHPSISREMRQITKEMSQVSFSIIYDIPLVKDRFVIAMPITA